MSPGLQPGLRDQQVPYLLLMGAAAVWAVSIVFVRGHPFQSSALVLAPWQTGVAAALLVPFALMLDGRFPPVDFRGIASLAFVGPMATALAYWALVEAGRSASRSIGTFPKPEASMRSGSLRFVAQSPSRSPILPYTHDPVQTLVSSVESGSP